MPINPSQITWDNIMPTFTTTDLGGLQPDPQPAVAPDTPWHIFGVLVPLELDTVKAIFFLHTQDDDGSMLPEYDLSGLGEQLVGLIGNYYNGFEIEDAWIKTRNLLMDYGFKHPVLGSTIFQIPPAIFSSPVDIPVSSVYWESSPVPAAGQAAPGAKILKNKPMNDAEYDAKWPKRYETPEDASARLSGTIVRFKNHPVRIKHFKGFSFIIDPLKNTPESEKLPALVNSDNPDLDTSSPPLGYLNDYGHARTGYVMRSPLRMWKDSICGKNTTIKWSSGKTQNIDYAPGDGIHNMITGLYENMSTAWAISAEGGSMAFDRHFAFKSVRTQSGIRVFLHHRDKAIGIIHHNGRGNLSASLFPRVNNVLWLVKKLETHGLNSK